MKNIHQFLFMSAFVALWAPNLAFAYPAGYDTTDRCNKKDPQYDAVSADAYKKAHDAGFDAYYKIEKPALAQLGVETEACNKNMFSFQFVDAAAEANKNTNPEYLAKKKVWETSLAGCKESAFKTYVAAKDGANEILKQALADAYQQFCWPKNADGGNMSKKNSVSCAAPLVTQAKAEYAEVLKKAKQEQQYTKAEALKTYQAALKDAAATYKKSVLMTKSSDAPKTNLLAAKKAYTQAVKTAKSAYTDSVKNANSTYADVALNAKKEYGQTVEEAKAACK